MTSEFFSDRFPDLNSFLIWFNDEVPLHYHGMQPDDVVVAEYVRTAQEGLLRALTDAKRVLALPEFPAAKIAGGSVINRRFADEDRDVKPWFLSMLKLLEQEADRCGYEIPDDLRGLWKQ